MFIESEVITPSTKFENLISLYEGFSRTALVTCAMPHDPENQK